MFQPCEAELYLRECRIPDRPPWWQPGCLLCLAELRGAGVQPHRDPQVLKGEKGEKGEEGEYGPDG